MSITLEQRDCNHNFNENYICSKCGFQDLMKLNMKNLKNFDLKMLEKNWNKSLIKGKK